MRIIYLSFVLGLALGVTGARAQTDPTPKNPTIAEWTCPDHDLDDQHELAIYTVTGTTRTMLTTILLGDPPYVDAGTKLVRASINVQPITFGEYVATINAVSSGLKSDPSPESNTFVRVPGAPSKPVIK